MDPKRTKTFYPRSKLLENFTSTANDVFALMKDINMTAKKIRNVAGAIAPNSFLDEVFKHANPEELERLQNIKNSMDNTVFDLVNISEQVDNAALAIRDVGGRVLEISGQYVPIDRDISIREEKEAK